MRKLFMAALLVACAAPFAFAQTGDDYNKHDIFIGYSHNRVDTGIDAPNQNFLDEREGFNGINASVKGNVSRYVGLKGDYSFHRKSFDVSNAAASFNVDADIHNILGGVEFKDNARETRVKPFAHLLAGVAVTKTDVENLPEADDDETGFAAAIGGGIDFRINDRVDFRAIQFDWNPNRSDGETSHNFRIGIGIVFR